MELYRVLPKESFELLLRNITVRESLENLWKYYQRTGRLEYGNEFEEIFNVIFRFFFRPLEIFLAGEGIIKAITPDPTIFRLSEAQRNVIEAYNDFIKSWLEHVNLTVRVFSGFTTVEPGKTAIDRFVDVWRDAVDRTQSKFQKVEMSDLSIFSDYPFLLVKEASENLFKAVEHWDAFHSNYLEFKRLMKHGYRRAVDAFVNHVNNVKVESYDEFSQLFQNFAAREFDNLLKSEDYLEVQKALTHSLMDHIYCVRRFYELLLENNPYNPFATLSQIDEAYYRILDLRRKVRELEGRIKKLEEES
jgi:hypothetical protein